MILSLTLSLSVFTLCIPDHVCLQLTQTLCSVGFRLSKTGCWIHSSLYPRRTMSDQEGWLWDGFWELLLRCKVELWLELCVVTVRSLIPLNASLSSRSQSGNAEVRLLRNASVSSHQGMCLFFPLCMLTIVPFAFVFDSLMEDDFFLLLL